MMVHPRQRWARRIAIDRAAVRNLSSHIYGGLLVAVLLASGLAAVLFAAGIIIGGESGPRLAGVAAAVLRWCMTGAGVAIAAGLATVYLSGRHSLSLDDAHLVDSATRQRGERDADQALGTDGRLERGEEHPQ